MPDPQNPSEFLKIPESRPLPTFKAWVRAIVAEHRLCKPLPSNPTALVHLPVENDHGRARFTIRCTACEAQWSHTIKETYEQMAEDREHLNDTKETDR
jgi:hypothetical protein